jgi:hypothetical protein
MNEDHMEVSRNAVEASIKESSPEPTSTSTDFGGSHRDYGLIVDFGSVHNS